MGKARRGLRILAALLLTLQGRSAAPAHLRALPAEASGAALRSAAVAVHQSLAPDHHEAGQQRWQAEISTLLTGLLNKLEPTAAHQKTAQATTQSKDAEKKAVEGAQPLTIQVPEKELKSFLGQLSQQCREQFSAIIQDQGPPIHTYGSAGSNKTAAACTSLHGVLCATQAYVTERSAAHGRSLHAVTTVEGDGCLPRNCLAQKDLEALATFLQLKAKDAIPGGNTEVTLNVDCRRGGGSMAEVGNATGATRAASSSSSSQDSKEGSSERSAPHPHEGSRRRRSDLSKSAASLLAPSVLATSALTWFVLLGAMR